jgi:hypothetical protein
MSNNPGGKTISFISGILIGVFAGLGLFFLVTIGFNPLRVFSDSNSGQTQDTLVDLRKNSTEPFVKSSKQNTETAPIEIIETAQDSIVPANQLDSIAVSNISNSEFNSEEIIVKRDELIESRLLKLTVLNRNTTKGKTDSLISVFQGSSSQSIEYRIEFWRSPINYRGFKFIRNAIVTFGLDPNESSRLFQLEDKFYLKHGISVYRLFMTEKFEPFSKVIDENLIKQLR